ncbi:MAG: DUF190 domain-containing protein [candidate division Zixibacteria bacterium]|nr:DUF190 domain-containing protein [candidate division Zixibacteria bacterium]
MKIEGEGRLLRIFVGENESWQGKPLYEAIIHKVKEHGLAGATALRGIAGFGADSRIHTTKILRLAENLPVVVEIVDKTEHIEKILPILDQMVSTEGLITIEKVDIIAYRPRLAEAE